MTGLTKKIDNIAATDHDRERVLTKAVLNVATELGITDQQLAQILDIEPNLVAKFRNAHGTLEIDTDSFRHAALLVRVFRSLYAITGGEQLVNQSWMKSYNTALNNSPINCVFTKSGLENVVKYLDTRRAKI